MGIGQDRDLSQQKMSGLECEQLTDKYLFWNISCFSSKFSGPNPASQLSCFKIPDETRVSGMTALQTTVLRGLHINLDITWNVGCIVTERGRTRSLWRSLVTGQEQLTQLCLTRVPWAPCELFWWHSSSQKEKQSLHEGLPPWTQTSLLVKTVPCQYPSQLSSKLNYRR